MGEESEDNQLPSEEEADISDEEEERGSSAEEGSDNEGDEEDDEEGSDDEGGDDDSDASPSARRRPKKRSKPFVPPPPRELPKRSTRGARIGNTDPEEGDEEFWNQEFFQDEENDERYVTESEPEDRFDADFNESEDEGDEEEEAAEAEKEAAAKEKKKKVLKPPGYKKPPLPRPRVKQEEGTGDAGGRGGPATGAGAPRRRKPSIGPEDFTVERRTVRESTRQKVEEGEMERKLAEKHKPRRAAPRSSNYRPLTQAELLAEAAKTEIENTKSLELLVLIEEETRKKAQVVKRRYAGPMVRWKSRRVGDAEVTTLEVRNMAMPDELRRRVAPPAAPRAVCAVTGRPARYRDPATGLPYATLEAFRELKRQREAGQLPTGAASLGAMGVNGMAGVVAAGQLAGAAGAAGYATRHAAAAAQPQYVDMGQAAFQPAALFQQQEQQPGQQVFAAGLPGAQPPQATAALQAFGIT